MGVLVGTGLKEHHGPDLLPSYVGSVVETRLCWLSLLPPYDPLSLPQDNNTRHQESYPTLDTVLKHLALLLRRDCRMWIESWSCA